MSILARAYPESPEQTGILLTHLGQARFVFNTALAQRKLCDRNSRDRGVRVNLASQCRELTEARNDVDWLKAGSTVVQQGALRDLDRAFANFFAGRARFPRFRRKRDRQGFAVRDVSLRRYNRKWAAILVPKAGWLKFRLTRSWPEVQQATGARVSYRNGRWQVSLTTPPPAKPQGGSGVVGLDRGVAVSVATSDGELLQAPALTDAECRRFTALEKRLARQTRGSRRYEATRAKMGRIRLRLGDRRTDWVEQETTRLARTYAVAGAEGLNIAAMVRRPAPKPDGQGSYLPNGASAKTGLSRMILAQVWGKFVSRLGDKMEVVRVDPRYTSQRCNPCGHTARDNRESQAVFSCKKCGHTANADVNAAKNVHDSVIAVLGRGTPGYRAKGFPDVNLQLTG